jgi:hypothetical protein
MPMLQVRDFPQDMYDKLALAAKEERRSIPQETIVAVQRGLAMKPESLEIAENRARRRAIIEEIKKRNFHFPDDMPSSEQMVREDRDR